MFCFAMKGMLIEKWKALGLADEKLLTAFRNVPRELFVLERFVSEAYGDYPLPILSGQTISQPTTVMVMTAALELKPGYKVLEVGSGSGYQAAIIAELVKPEGKVITVDVIKGLVDFAANNLKKANIKNVEVIHYNGSTGYSKEAPYDRIIVTAAAPTIPKPLLAQLKVGGILVIPVGPSYTQELLKIRKTAKDKFDIKNLGDFVFVPLAAAENKR